MSARKITDTKIPEDNEGDSGFLSGPVDKLPGDSGEITGEMSDEIKSDQKKVQSVVSAGAQCFDSGLVTDIDSGLISDLTDDLTDLKLDGTGTVVPAQCPRISLSADTNTHSQLPPLAVLFQQDNDGDTQLHIAAVHGCEKAVSTLIRVCPNKDWFNVPNDDGQTALHLAALSGNTVVTRMLVIAGASLAVRDRTGETPLHKATVLKNVECIKALLTSVKELPQGKLTAVLNQKNYNGQACVHLAASAGHIETLKALVFYKADINCRENLAGWTPLHICAHRGDAATAAWLRERGGADPRARDCAGRTPRRLARARRHSAVLRALAAAHPADSDSESDSDDDMYDSDSESFFELLSHNPQLVA